MSYSTEAPLSLVSKADTPAPIQTWAIASQIQTKNSSESPLALDKLRTKHLGHHVLYADALPSTQTLLQKITLDLRPHDLPDFRLVCWTPIQQSGKGRGTNTWVSPEGCLTFSFQSVLTDGSNLPFMQYLVSLAIIRTTQRFGASNVFIKWPNDIYADNKKISGMLCQSEFFQGRFYVTTGIGFNISNAEPTICLNQLIPKAITKEEFLVEFCNVYEPMEEQFQAEGFQPFVEEYTAHWLHTNQVVQVQGDNPGDAPMRATIQGLTATGCLLATTEAGEKYELYPDGNSFDFFSGLLKRKL
ncbi:unnamed protein product [Aphanomyces euteiches]